MPEGPSILILLEEASVFEGKKIIEATGYAKIDLEKLAGKKITRFRSHGKHFLICFKKSYIRIHLLMFGSYRINEEKHNNPALSLKFKNGMLNFYTCSVKWFETNAEDDYDWRNDVLAEEWDPKAAVSLLRKKKNYNVCDALLNQEIFSGVGNIIKNEVLYRVKIHPRSDIGALPLKQLRLLVKEAANYSWDFYNWKKQFVLKKHWLIYKKKKCKRCNMPSEKDHLGVGKRLTVFCNHCQVLYK